MLMRSLFITGLLFASLPIAALAQGRPIGLAERKAGRDHALELEFDFSRVTYDAPSDTAVTTLLPKLYGSFGLTQHLELEVTLPTVFVDIEPELGEGDSAFLFANPALALFYADRTQTSVARIGLGVALPLFDPDSGAELAAPLMAAATRGLQDPWLYVPDAFSIFVPGQVQLRSDGLVLGFDAALGLLVDTDSSEEEDDAEVSVQAGALFGGVLDDTTLGLRLQLASFLTGEGDDTQVGLMPFVQADLDGGAFIHGGLLLNLDDPVGLFGDNPMEVWALRIGAGARF